MNTRLNRTTFAWLAAAVLSVAGCDGDRTIGAVARGPSADLEKQYVETIDRLLPGMGAEKIVDRKDAQMAFEAICFAASAPDKPAERAALCRAIMTKVGPDTAKPARVWLLRKVEPIGRDEVVASLTALFRDEDPEIRELARRALQNNPSPKAAAALRAELATTPTAEWRVALINALGARRDATSVPALSELASDPDACVAKAAVAALGDIATDPAVQTLGKLRKTAQPPLRDTVIDASIRAAEVLVTRGERDAAAAIYEELGASSQPERIRIAAVEGLARARGVKAVPRLVALVNWTDPHMRLVAAQALQDIPDPKVTSELAAALDNASPAAAATLLDVLGRRGDRAAMPAVLKRVTAADPDVRIAALGALKQTGDGSVVAVLAERMTKTEGDEYATAYDSLVHLQGQDVDKAILATIDGPPSPVRTALVKVAAARHIRAALPAFYGTAKEADEGTRTVVIAALGTMAPADDYPKMVDLLVNAKGDATIKAAEAAVLSVSQQIDDQARRVAPIAAALPDAPVPAQVAMIHILGQIQGDAALAALRGISKSPATAVQDAAAEALSKWSGQHCLTWLFSGPYKKEGKNATDLFDIAFDPEQPDAKVAWKPLDIEGNKQNGEIVLSKVHKDQDACAYAKVTIVSDKDQEVRFTFGSDDGIKVWLNDKVIHAKNVARSLKCGEDAVPARLKKGQNPLLIKITQGGGDWAFCCSVQNPEGGPPDGLKFRTKGRR